MCRASGCNTRPAKAETTLRARPGASKSDMTATMGVMETVMETMCTMISKWVSPDLTER